jgi:hypothetical protein
VKGGFVYGDSPVQKPNTADRIPQEKKLLRITQKPENMT